MDQPAASQYYLGPMLAFDFPAPAESPPAAPVPESPPAKARVQVEIDAAAPDFDPYAVPVVVPAYDPAAHYQLQKILVKYAPLRYVPADETAEWWLAYTGAPSVELDPPAPGDGGTVKGRLDQVLEGAYVIRVILQADAA